MKREVNKGPDGENQEAESLTDATQLVPGGLEAGGELPEHLRPHNQPGPSPPAPPPLNPPTITRN
jgi:hypothetical protein